MKNLQANLRHLTGKTRRIAGGDFGYSVDFMGDFSIALNSTTQQLKDSYEQLDRALAEANLLLAKAAR